MISVYDTCTRWRNERERGRGAFFGRRVRRGVAWAEEGGREKSTVAKVRKKGIRSIDSRTFVAGVTPFSSQAFILDQTTPRRLSDVQGGVSSLAGIALHEVVNLISPDKTCLRTHTHRYVYVCMYVFVNVYMYVYRTVI